MLKLQNCSPKSILEQGWGAAEAECLEIRSQFAQIPETFAKINFRTGVGGGAAYAECLGIRIHFAQIPEAFPKINFRTRVGVAAEAEYLRIWSNFAQIAELFAKINFRTIMGGGCRSRMFGYLKPIWSNSRNVRQNKLQNKGGGIADAECLWIWRHFAQIPESFAKIKFRTGVWVQFCSNYRTVRRNQL